MSIDRFIMGFAGAMVLLGTGLGMFVNHNFLYLSFVYRLHAFSSINYQILSNGVDCKKNGRSK